MMCRGITHRVLGHSRYYDTDSEEVRDEGSQWCRWQILGNIVISVVLEMQSSERTTMTYWEYSGTYTQSIIIRPFGII